MVRYTKYLSKKKMPILYKIFQKWQGENYFYSFLCYKNYLGIKPIKENGTLFVMKM